MNKLYIVEVSGLLTKFVCKRYLVCFELSVMLRVVQYNRTESDRLRYAPTRLAGRPMARDSENKHITRVMSLQRVGKVGGLSRSDTDEHDPSLRTPTRLAGRPMARD